jgi:hypothetical protein
MNAPLRDSSFVHITTTQPFLHLLPNPHSRTCPRQNPPLPLVPLPLLPPRARPPCILLHLPLLPPHYIRPLLDAQHNVAEVRARLGNTLHTARQSNRSAPLRSIEAKGNKTSPHSAPDSTKSTSPHARECALLLPCAALLHSSPPPPSPSPSPQQKQQKQRRGCYTPYSAPASCAAPRRMGARAPGGLVPW